MVRTRNYSEQRGDKAADAALTVAPLPAKRYARTPEEYFAADQSLEEDQDDGWSTVESNSKKRDHQNETTTTPKKMRVENYYNVLSKERDEKTIAEDTVTEFSSKETREEERKNGS